MIGDPFIHTNQQSTKVFFIADGRQFPGSNIAKFHHLIREPTQTVDMVPVLAGQSLLSGAKLAEAGNISVCNNDKDNLYDIQTALIKVL